MLNEDPKVLAKKILKFEEITRKSGEYQKKLEDEIISLKKQLRSHLEQEHLLRQDLQQTKRHYNSLQSSHKKLNHDYLTLLDTMRTKKAKRQQLSQSLKFLENQFTDEQLLSKTLVQTLTNENSELKLQLHEKQWISDQNFKNLQIIKEELNEQLKIAKNSEMMFKKSLENLQKEFKEKENILNEYDEKFKLTQESLRLFYTAVKYKEDQINQEKLKRQEIEAKDSVLRSTLKNLQQEVKSLKHEKGEETIKKRREDFMSKCSVYSNP